MEDNFIRENNEKKALKLAFSELLKHVSAELLRTKRSKYSDRTMEFALLLGTDHYNLLLDASLYPGVDVMDLSELDVFGFKKSNIKLYGLPVYVSLNNKDLVEVIITAGSLMNNETVFHESIKLCDRGDKERMEKYISKLPESVRFRRVLTEELI